MKPVPEDRFDLLFLYSIDEVRRWPGEVDAVSRGFVIRRQERGVEHVMDSPGDRKFQTEGDGGNDCADAEGSVPLWCQLRHVMEESEMSSLEPYVIANLVLILERLRVIHYPVQRFRGFSPSVRHFFDTGLGSVIQRCRRLQGR